ncbi:MAG: cell envelope integrity protein CreD [Pseudomonadota bacterium]
MTDTPDLPGDAAADRTRSVLRTFFASRGWRFAMLILLTILMFIPLLMVGFVIEDRASYKRQATREISHQWGGPIHISGLVMVLPVEREIEVAVKNDVLGTRPRKEKQTAPATPVLLLPEQVAVTIDGKTEIRSRGIFEVPVYGADLDMAIDIDIARVASTLAENETVLWDQATLALIMPGTRNMTGRAVLGAGDEVFDLEPGTPLKGEIGIQAAIGDPRGVRKFNLSMRLNGARTLSFAPTARMTEVKMVSNWPHPNFTGGFLPKTREISDEGFNAKWEVPHLASAMPQVWRGTWQGGASFGVDLFNPVDIYQKVQRAAKYGILFIALTFLTVFLVERLSTRAAHPAQLILIGIAQCIFFLLLLSFSEQFGFTPAYLGASAATIGLIGVYGKSALDLAKKTWILVGCLTALYATLYLILRSTDYALLAGSVLAFAAVALAMLMTRGDNWSGSGTRAVPA